MRQHPFPKSPREAVSLQRELCSKILLKSLKKEPRILAGFDLAYISSDRAIAGCVLFSYPKLEILDMISSTAACSFPYIPGLLSFREIPALLRLWKKIKRKPDLIFVDGQGIAHPRGIGIASHLGLILKKPTIGVAKSLLVGEYEEPTQKRGARSSLVHKGRTVGAVLRTRKYVKPIFVSPGHLIGLQDSIKWVMRVTGKYRIPEPTRQAHMYVTQLKKVLGGRG